MTWCSKLQFLASASPGTNGIDTFVVVDVHYLLFGQPMSRNRLADEPIQNNTFKKERKSFRENTEKLTY